MYASINKPTNSSESDDMQHASKEGMGSSVFQFKDQREESIRFSKTKDAVSESSKAQTIRPIQEMAIQFAERQKMPVQKKENNTGLPDNLKSGVESLSGYSLDDVKVHYNSGQPAQLQAHAYAQGTDIHVAPGQEQHLPHEAWHVVQQKQGRVNPTLQLKGVAINDNDSLEQEADTMGGKALQMMSETGQSIDAGERGPVQFVSKQSTVVQRQTIQLGIRSFGREINERDFAAFIGTLGEGYSYDLRKHILVTVGAETFADMLSRYREYKESNEKESAETVAEPEVTKEDLRNFGEACVREFFNDDQIEIITQIGKNNHGIYKVTGEDGQPMIVKVLGPGYSSESLVETFKSNKELKEKFAESQRQGKFEINRLIEHKSFTKGPLKITLAVYYEQGVMSLDDALLHQNVDLGVLIGAARGLASRTARFHFAPIVEGDVTKGRYLSHGDFNTSNIMLDFEGIMGLIDTDDLKQGSDIASIIWDINSLHTSLKTALEIRYKNDPEKDGKAIFEQMEIAFKTRYVQAMGELNIPEADKIAARL